MKSSPSSTPAGMTAWSMFINWQSTEYSPGRLNCHAELVKLVVFRGLVKLFLLDVKESLISQ